jgi:hypothetical protein
VWNNYDWDSNSWGAATLLTRCDGRYPRCDGRVCFSGVRFASGFGCLMRSSGMAHHCGAARHARAERCPKHLTTQGRHAHHLGSMCPAPARTRPPVAAPTTRTAPHAPHRTTRTAPHAPHHTPRDRLFPANPLPAERLAAFIRAWTKGESSMGSRAPFAMCACLAHALRMHMWLALGELLDACCASRLTCDLRAAAPSTREIVV